MPIIPSNRIGYAYDDLKTSVTTVAVGLVAWQVIGAVLPLFPLIGCFCVAIGCVGLFHTVSMITSGEAIESADDYKQNMPELGEYALHACRFINYCVFSLVSKL
ncbi:MAG: hypothetical protein P0S94_03635 [Simkaniaceae bacterium]|nr:hypothetical protein [Simkaniaceae bacterium]